MSVTQCLLALVALYVGLAHSWDIAVGFGNQLIFYTDGTKANNVTFISRNIAALAYDGVHNRMLYVDKQSNNDAICGYDISSRENKCFINRPGSNINSIAYDPATQTLFFTDTNDNSINWISIKPGSVNNVSGNLLIKMDDRTPSDIAVDSCKGYIYWINTNNNKNMYKTSIERARFNGSTREIINREYDLYEVSTLVIDPITRKMYYFDGYLYGGVYELMHLNHADFNGQHEKMMYYYNNRHYSGAKELTASKDYLYWVNGSESYNTVCQLPKNGMEDREPKKISEFNTEKPLTIAANYKIDGLIQSLQDCEDLSSLIPPITVTNNSLNIEQTTEYTTSVYNCTLGYIGERCEVSICQNYCLQGNCSLTDEGLAACSCNAGYIGERCDVNVCSGYCLNNGTCSLNDSSEPVCECKGDYVGDRCEVSHCLNYCIQGNSSVNDEGLPTCRCNAGYSGKRCEVYVCAGYCLNDGACSLNEEDEPVCQCAANHEGSRCEADTNDTAADTPTYDLAKRNLTIADLLSRWRKPSSKMFLVVEV